MARSPYHSHANPPSAGCLFRKWYRDNATRFGLAPALSDDRPSSPCLLESVPSPAPASFFSCSYCNPCPVNAYKCTMPSPQDAQVRGERNTIDGSSFYWSRVLQHRRAQLTTPLYTRLCVRVINRDRLTIGCRFCPAALALFVRRRKPNLRLERRREASLARRTRQMSPILSSSFTQLRASCYFAGKHPWECNDTQCATCATIATISIRIPCIF